MSTEQKFKMYYGSREATADELAHVEEIVVEQEMDLAWHASIKLFLCLDDRGKWRHVDDEFLQSFKRVRIELQLGGSKWVPLIDGPIVERRPDLDAQPGRSTITLSVSDDTAFLNRQEAVDVYEGKSDDQVARKLFGLATTITPKRIESAPGPSTGVAKARVLRGTAIQQLRQLARRHKFHAYVLPAEEVGKSIGCFLPDPTKDDGLPDLVVLGSDRNVSNLQVTEEAQTPTRFQARSLSISDKQVTSRTSRLQELTLLAPKPLQIESQTATQLLRPDEIEEDDPNLAVQGAAQPTIYSLRATGRVIPGRYAGVLQPYRVVTIRVGSTGLSGSYLLTKVTHRITPSTYTQEFSAKRNGVEKTNAPPDILGGII